MHCRRTVANGFEWGNRRRAHTNLTMSDDEEQKERPITPLQAIFVLFLAALGWAIMILIYIYE